MTETEDQRIIRIADIMVAHADYTGLIDKDCLDVIGAFSKNVLPPALAAIREELRSTQPNSFDASTNGTHLDITTAYATKNYDDVKTHLVNNSYIDNPRPQTQAWILNDVGKKMKQLKGHKKYQEYIDKKLKAEIAEMNGKIHWLRRVIITAIVAALVGYGLRYLTEPKQKAPTDQSLSTEKSQTTPPNPTEKKDSSENQ
jgi:hypothetical protein